MGLGFGGILWIGRDCLMVCPSFIFFFFFFPFHFGLALFRFVVYNFVGAC